MIKQRGGQKSIYSTYINMLTVAHAINPFLFLTGSWIYNQIRFPGTARHIVVTSLRQNEELFPFDSVFSLQDANLFRRMRDYVANRFLRAHRSYWSKVCRAEKVDILHSHFGSAGVQNIALAKKLSIPHVVSFYGADIIRPMLKNHATRRRYQLLFDTVDLVLAEGPFAKSLLEKNGCPPGKIRVSHLGVDLSSLKKVERFWNIDEPFKVFIVSTFTQKKGIQIALRALVRLLEMMPSLNLKLTLVGEARPDMEGQTTKREIEQIISSTKLKGLTSLCGYLPYEQVIRLSEDQHLLLQTSVTADDGDCEGGFPVIITDMMAKGIPVIGSSHCDIPEIVKDGYNGRIVIEKDVYSTCAAIKELIESYNDNRARWSSFNDGFLQQEFDARKCALEREAIYAELIN